MDANSRAKILSRQQQGISKRELWMDRIEIENGRIDSDAMEFRKLASRL